MTSSGLAYSYSTVLTQIPQKEPVHARRPDQPARAAARPPPRRPRQRRPCRLARPPRHRRAQHRRRLLRARPRPRDSDATPTAPRRCSSCSRARSRSSSATSAGARPQGRSRSSPRRCRTTSSASASPPPASPASSAPAPIVSVFDASGCPRHPRARHAAARRARRLTRPPPQTRKELHAARLPLHRLASPTRSRSEPSTAAFGVDNYFDGVMTDGALTGARVRGVDQVRIREDGSAVLDIRETIETDLGAIAADVRGYAMPTADAPNLHTITGFALFSTAVPEYAAYNMAVVGDRRQRRHGHRHDRGRRPGARARRRGGVSRLTGRRDIRPRPAVDGGRGMAPPRIDGRAAGLRTPARCRRRARAGRHARPRPPHPRPTRRAQRVHRRRAGIVEARLAQVADRGPAPARRRTPQHRGRDGEHPLAGTARAAGRPRSPGVPDAAPQPRLVRRPRRTTPANGTRTASAPASSGSSTPARAGNCSRSARSARSTRC